jgi:hypothetical protein
VKQIWTWKEPMSTPAKNLTTRRPKPWSVVEAIENFFSPIVRIIGGCLGAILMLGAMILGLYLFLVLIKFLWARA